MTTVFRIFASVCLTLVVASMSVAKEWRGIVPLKSTRLDVERLLGTPTEKSDAGYLYKLRAEWVAIWFQTEPCDNCGLGWNIPLGTVTTIGIIPRLVRPKERFIDVSRAKTLNEKAGFIYYTNEVEGLSVESFNGRVTHITYGPTEHQASLACPRGDCIVDFFPRFDEYANLSWEDEKARLDNYAIQLKNTMGRGAVVVYGNNSLERQKLIKRAMRARKHLQSRGIDAVRILIVDGGYREQSLFELNVYLMGGLAERIYIFPERNPKTKPRTD